MYIFQRKVSKHTATIEHAKGITEVMCNVVVGTFKKKTLIIIPAGRGFSDYVSPEP